MCPRVPRQSHADDTTLKAESEEELKSLLMKVKGEGEKVGLKLNIQQTTWALEHRLNSRGAWAHLL